MHRIDQILRAVLTAPMFLILWGVLVAASVAVLVPDLRTRNAHLHSLMQWVWIFTIVYSGPLGLAHTNGHSE